MDLIKVMERFPTQETCIAYLESVKWGKNPPYCPHLSDNRRKEADRDRNRAYRTLELPRLPSHLQSDARNSVPRKPENRITEVVSGNLTYCQCQEKFVKPASCHAIWT